MAFSKFLSESIFPKVSPDIFVVDEFTSGLFFLIEFFLPLIFFFRFFCLFTVTGRFFLESFVGFFIQELYFTHVF